MRNIFGIVSAVLLTAAGACGDVRTAMLDGGGGAGGETGAAGATGIAGVTGLAGAPGGAGGDPGCAAGREGCVCYGNWTCDGNLTCASNVCVRPAVGGAGGIGGSSVGGRGGSTGTANTTGQGAGGGTTGTGNVTGSAGTSGCGTCPAAATCVSGACVCQGQGQLLCNNQCVDTQASNAHCGGCNRPCTGTCMNGVCMTATGAGGSGGTPPSCVQLGWSPTNGSLCNGRTNDRRCSICTTPDRPTSVAVDCIWVTPLSEEMLCVTSCTKCP